MPLDLYPPRHDFVRITTQPAIIELGAFFGAMCAERDYLLADGKPDPYADATPRDSGDCILQVTRGLWRPMLWYYCGILGGGHWLHDMDETSSWIGGYTLPTFRSQANLYIRQGIRQRVKDAIADMGYVTVHAAVAAHNTAAQKWAEQAQGSTRVGLFERWLPVGGVLTDFVVYTFRPEDVEQAMIDAEARRQS